MRIPLSHAQRQLWLLQELDPGSSVLHIPYAVWLRGRLDLAALEAGLNRLRRRHDVLRSRLDRSQGEPRLCIAPPVDLPLPVIDLQRFPPGDREDAARRLLDEDAHRPFNVDAGPLVRTLLLRLSAEDHILYQCLHHLVADAWSIRTIRRELAADYEALSGNACRPADTRPGQFAEYVQWEQESLASDVWQAQRPYWKQKLAKFDAPTSLPTDRPRRPGAVRHGARLPIQIPSDVTAALHTLSRQTGSTLFMTLTAGLKSLLARYTGQEDIGIGTVLASRRRPETRDIVGPLLNTLLLRTDLGGAPTFRQVLQRVRQTALEAYSNHDLPFDLVLQELRREAGGGSSSPYNVLFVMEPARQQYFGNLHATSMAFDLRTARCDLTLQLTEVLGDLVGYWEYDTELFDAATVTHFSHQLIRLLHSAAVDPDQHVARIPLLTQQERSEMLRVNQGATTDAMRTPIPVWISEQAANSPEKIALDGSGETLTYSALDRRVNQLASHLLSVGVGADSIVGIGLDRTPDLVVSILATWKAGAAYVPLDPYQPLERQSWIVEDVQPTVLLTHRGWASRFQSMGSRVLELDSEREQIGKQSPEAPAVLIDPQKLAYVLHTSGSTGRPKGVAVTHAALSNCLESMLKEPGLLPSDVLLAITTPSFDIAMLELFLPLMAGGRVVLASHETARDGYALADLLAQSGATVMQATPTTWRLLLETEVSLQGLKVLSGGEPLSRELADRLLARGAAAVWNLYGPTETTIWSSVSRVSESGPVGLGQAIANTQLVVLDDALQPVPPGVPGELYIGGQGLARGYWQKDDLTAERFIQNPFPEIPSERLYRTGDRVRYRADGTLVHLGRMDHQVKIRGVRMELDEIETAICRHADIQDACVMVGTDAAGEAELTAYVVPRPSHQVDLPSLRGNLSQQLPAAMIPQRWVMLDRLPCSASGKIDRRSLPPPEVTVAPPLHAGGAVKTPIEELLGEIWTQLLEVPELRGEDNFFELGGHSLTATRLASRVRQIFEVELPVREVFQHPTLAGLSRRLNHLRQLALEAAPQPPSPPLQPVSHDAGDIPLSFAQQRLWFLQQLDPESTVYHLPLTMRLTGTLDIAALEQSLGELLRRHASLRTTFHFEQGQPIQRTSPPGFFPMPVHDFSQLPSAEREDAWRRFVGEETRRPFDLVSGPLFRPMLLRIGESEHVFHYTMHHLISDQWSVELFWRELSTVYESLTATKRVEGAAPSLQFSDFCSWQRQQGPSDAWSRAVTYWKQQLSGAPATLELPTDHPRPESPNFRGGQVSQLLTTEQTEQLKRLARSENATLFMLLLGAFQLMLGRHAGQHDVVVGCPVAGRTRVELEKLIGFFVNFLPLRLEWSGKWTFRELVSQVRQRVLDAYSLQDLPFEKLVEELHPPRMLNRTPIFQIVFNMLNVPSGGETFAGLTVERIPAAEIDSKFDLTLYAREQDGRLRLTLVYDRDLFEESRAAECLAQLQHLLAQVIADPESPVERLSLVTPAARARLPDPTARFPHRWVGSAKTETAVPARSGGHTSPSPFSEEDGTLHAAVMRQVRRVPDRIAVVDSRRKWTYRELDAASNQVAHYLLAKGLRPEDTVAILAARRGELVAALLGVSKAGGAFLLLDPAYPPQRIAHGIRVVRPRGWLHVLPTDDRRHAPTAGLAQLPSPFHLELAGDDCPELAEYPTTELDVARDADRLAYVAMTSGTGGTPRAILGTHRPVTRFVAWQQQAFRLTERDRFSLLSGLSHDPILRDVFTPLSLGATVVIPEESDLMPGQLAGWMARNAITVAHLTPLLAQVLVHSARAVENSTHSQLSALRYFFLGGDRLTSATVASLQQVAKNARCVNVYGTTETPQVMGYCVVESSPDNDRPGTQSSDAGVSVPIGTGVPHAQLLVLNPAGQLAGVGELGEIHIRSPYLARGYLDDAEATRFAFLPNPFGGGENDRVYRTGDLGRYRCDGQVDLVGRRDRQVKVRGYRVELEEIETFLRRQPGIRDAAVWVRPGGTGNATLVAAVVAADPSAPISPRSIRRDMQLQLPDFLVPATIDIVAALPKTPNGKVDRPGLATVPAFDLPADPRHSSGELSPLASAIAEVWREVLHVDHVGAYDHFLDLGGHSLLAMEVIARLERTLGLRVSPRDMMFQTVGQLAASCEDLVSEPPPQAGWTFRQAVQTVTQLFSQPGPER